SSTARSTTSRTARRDGSGLRLWRRRVVAAAAVGHELVELRLVLGLTQAVQKFEEIALLVFEATQGLAAVFVKSGVTARALAAWAAPARSPRRSPGTPAARRLLHPLHSFLHPPLPAIMPAVCPASHDATAPYQKSQGDEADRPPHDKARNHQSDPGRLADVVRACRDRHGRSS